MNEHTIEIGLLKEKILMMKKCKAFDDEVKNDENLERLKKIHEYFEYIKRENERIMKMSRTEYAHHCKLEIDRDIRELKQIGKKFDETTWKANGMKMLNATIKIKPFGGN